MRNKVYIVEDDMFQAQTMKEDLEDFDVVGIGSNKSDVINDLEKLNQNKSLPGIIIMDINISNNKMNDKSNISNSFLTSDENGISLAKEIRSQYNIPIVYTTAYDSDIVIEKAFETMPRAYLVKPIDEKTLITTIRLAIYAHKQAEKNKKENDYKIQFLTRISAILSTKFITINGYCESLENEVDSINTEDIVAVKSEFLGLRKSMVNLKEYIACLNNSENSIKEYFKISTILENLLIDSELATLIRNNNIEIQAEVEPVENYEVYANKNHLEMIFSEVIHNAIKFNHNNKEIKIIGSITNGNNIALSIKDQGSGIAESMLQDIYTLIKEDKPDPNIFAIESLGLGLPLAKKLCDQNDIILRIDSTEGEGTEVVIEMISKKLE